MNEEKYLEERLNDRLEWYDKKSARNKNWFHFLRLVEIVSAALIPFLSGMSDKIAYPQWLIGGLGVFIAVAAASISLFKFQENWVAYRTIAEQLKHEEFTYRANAKPYDAEDKFALLVVRVESLISKEHSKWSETIKRRTDAREVKKTSGSS